MTKINDVSAYKYTGTGSATSTSSSGGSDASSDFMELLLAQMRNQSPWDPMDDSQMLSQMAQLNTVEELKSIGSTLKELTANTNFLSTAGLIGKYANYITVNDEGNAEIATGRITSVASDGDDIFLTIGEDTVALSYLMEVSETELTPEDDTEEASEG